MTTDELIDNLNAHQPPALGKLNGSVHRYDDATQTIELRYQIDESFCHSGDIIQGGFVAGMLDAAMAHVVFVALGEAVIVATLEIKVSYLDIARPGELRAIGKIAKLGKSVAFLAAELHNKDGDLLAIASSTAKIIRKPPGS
ncbi:MAG: PaaI family thioesterase [Woeseiaceae bacterium]|nr:PaaI family thioesterase [Woeseiaceae bacterium]